jgi:flagellar L-ring protein precursor FlgH
MQLLSLAVLIAPLASGGKKPPKPPKMTALERYIQQSAVPLAAEGRSTPGSLWSSQAILADAAIDLRASRRNDIVTIVVAERASAVASGSSKATRASAAKANVGALAGITKATGPLQNLTNLSSGSQLQGEGATSRETVLTTSLSARVTQVMPNGNLVVEGSKNIVVGGENQMVTLRGVVRPVDLSTTNVVGSERIAMIEVQVNGKGIVGDAVRRPFILYRILLGLLPF